jgi:hypothetical protein
MTTGQCRARRIFRGDREDRARFQPVFLEENLFFLLYPIRALAPRAQGAVESEMAKKIERVGFRLIARGSQLVEVDATLL